MKFKPICLHLFLLAILVSCTDKSPLEPELENKHFDFVLYDGLSSLIIPDISVELESNYDRILGDLQIDSMPLIKVEIWSDYENFLAAMEENIGRRYPGATGYVTFSEICLFYVGNIPQTAVHEFVHVVSLHINTSIGNNPRWLWESVALYESGMFVDPQTLPYMVSGNYPTLEELNTDYNSSDHNIYSVGYTLLEYIIETWGKDSVIQLIQTNGNLQSALGISTPEFETGWYQFVVERYL